MEESVKKLRQFLNQIHWAETQTDEFRVKLTLPGAKRKIFLAIDQKFSNRITSEDICNFCNEKGFRTTPQTQQILGRYFKNWNEGIDYEQFVEIMNPKNIVYSLEETEDIDPIRIFILMMETVIKCYQNLQIMRERLEQNYEYIANYFEEKYSMSSGLTKQSLKKFMMDQNIYSRSKYEQVCHYIFGDTENQISWKSLLNLQSVQQDQIQNIPIKKCISVQKYKQTEQIQQQVQPDTTKRSRDQCSNINDVMAQIQQIQKQMKQKKIKGIQSVPLSPLKQNKQNKQNTQKQQFIGRVKAQNKINYKPQQIVQQKTQQKPMRASQNYQFQQQYYPKTWRFYQNDQYIPYTPAQTFTNSKYFGHSSNLKSPKKLNSVNSEAQLKILQIEKRAMDKYFGNSHRKQNYFLQDHNYDFNKKVPLQFVRQRSVQNLTSDRSFHHFQNNYQPIYKRNKASRMLYTNEGFWQRPVSPHFMRY